MNGLCDEILTRDGKIFIPFAAISALLPPLTETLIFRCNMPTHDKMIQYLE